MTWIFALVLIVIALILFLVSRRQQRCSGLPSLKVVYTDTKMWNRVEKPLYDPVLGLTGKPDYLVMEKDLIIPLEVKSGFAPAIPYDSHILQLVAYCMLVWSMYKKRPTHGFIHYANRTFAVDFTPQLEEEFRDLVSEIHHCDRSQNPSRSHESPERCRSCGYRDICDQKL
jgi:CRISPR-associated exonuclease Cas4